MSSKTNTNDTAEAKTLAAAETEPTKSTMRKVRVLKHELEYDGLVFSKGATCWMPTETAKEAEADGNVQIIGY